MKAITAESMAISVHQRLLNLNRQRGVDFNLLLTQFAIERLLYRLSCSNHQKHFVLKGAMLFVVWQLPIFRPTRDLDLLGFGRSSEETIRQRFTDLCQLEVPEDGVRFLVDSIRVSDIREEQEYIGKRVEMLAMLGRARIPLQIDIGFGDVLFPPAQSSEFPALLDFPAPQLQVYARETVVAEKLHAMVELDINNSRMKDFYDLWILSRHFTFDGALLIQSIQLTFGRRQTPLPSTAPLGLTAAFATHPHKLVQWNAFLRRTKLSVDNQSFAEVIAAIHDFLMPPLQSLSQATSFSQHWTPGRGWLDKT